MSYTEVFSGQNLFPAQLTYLELALTGDVTLQWSVEVALPGANIFPDILDLTSDMANRVVTFPDATIAAPGQSILVNNKGAFTILVDDADGNQIGSVPSGEVWQFYLDDNTTVAGSWTTFEFGTGTSSATAAALAGAGLKAITTTLNVQVTPRSSAVSPLAIIDSDRAKVVAWTGGVGAGTLPDPATLGSDWFCYLRNNGSGTWTITPAAGSVNGEATLALSAFSSCMIYTDGSDYYTVGLSQVTPTNFDFTSINVAGTGDYTLSGTELNRISYEFTGILTGNRNVIVPTSVQQYWIVNSTSGAFDLTVKTAAGTGVIVPFQGSIILFCDGTDVVAAVGLPASGIITLSKGGLGAEVVPDGMEDELFFYDSGAGQSTMAQLGARLEFTATVLNVASRYVSLTRGAGQVIANNTDTALIFVTENADVGGWWDAGTPADIVVPAGVSAVLIVATIKFTTTDFTESSWIFNAVIANVTSGFINTNTTTPVLAGGGGGGTASCTVSIPPTIIPVTPGDILRLRCSVDSDPDNLGCNAFGSISVMAVA
jgi:hypothetical protein